MVFATFAEDKEQLSNALALTESIREFAGKFRQAPVWIYVPENLLQDVPERFSTLHAEMRTTRAPEETRNFYFAQKVSAAANAETEARKRAAILVWMDVDTIVLKEPREFVLVKRMNLGYRPVMHTNIGSLYAEPPDSFWSRVYENLSVRESSTFPMATVADTNIIRPYFNAGLLVVRPERGILSRWAGDFEKLCKDSVLVEMCERDVKKKIFLHQAALTGTILSLLGREEMIELSAKYNYPIFFDEMFGAYKEFASIEGVVTLRHEGYFRNPKPEWSKKLKGPADRILWLEKHLVRGNTL